MEWLIILKKNDIRVPQDHAVLFLFYYPRKFLSAFLKKKVIRTPTFSTGVPRDFPNAKSVPRTKKG